jgi:SAM-dependent methyltransferase
VTEPKPAGWGAAYAAVFGHDDVVAAYRLRPPYPEETIQALAALAAGGAVLDAGCGTGELARRLAPLAERVDAVDVSAVMLAEGRTLPRGNAANLRWVHGSIEEAPLEPPYALGVAGDSIHWFDWASAMPRLREVLAGDGVLAVVHRDWLRNQRARERLRTVYARHSWNPDFQPLDPIEELERRGLFVKAGEHVSGPVPWRPTLDEIVECHFSMSGFARSRLDDPERFAREVREAVADSLTPTRERYELDVVGTVVWGAPSSGERSTTGTIR